MRNNLFIFGLVLLFATISCGEGESPIDTDTPEPQIASKHITKVFEYMPAVGSFVNISPLYEEGDTQESINAKVLKAIEGDTPNYITLGGYGGYVVVGFDTTIVNREGADFKVQGNAFYNISTPSGIAGGSFEPAIIMVSTDSNGDGLPNDKWYEIEGSAHRDAKQEEWYNHAAANDNDMEFVKEYEMVYYNSKSDNVIKWRDNKGNSGVINPLSTHRNGYYPEWIEADSLLFKGSRLPQNGVDESSDGLTIFVLYGFEYGYADNAPNGDMRTEIDINWAIDGNGESIYLENIDFIKIYNGVNQWNGWLGECSTEIAGITIID